MDRSLIPFLIFLNYCGWRFLDFTSSIFNMFYLFICNFIWNVSLIPKILAFQTRALIYRELGRRRKSMKERENKQLQKSISIDLSIIYYKSLLFKYIYIYIGSYNWWMHTMMTSGTIFYIFRTMWTNMPHGK